MSNWFQKLCGKITDHKYSIQVAETVDAEPTEYYHKCLICRLSFWNYEESERKSYK